MKKIILMAAALILAVSCSDWEGSNTEPLKMKIVDRLLFADGSDVRFIYGGENGLISRIEYSAGPTIDITYEGLGTGMPVVYVNDGTSVQAWNVSGGTVTSVSVNDASVITMQYDVHYFYDYLTFLANVDNCSRTTISWGNAVPNEKTTTWYDDDSFSTSGQKTRQLVRFGWSSQASPTNWLSSIDLLPFVVPEYTEGWGIDPAVVASVGLYCFRSYNLPGTVTVTLSDLDIQSPAIEGSDGDSDKVEPTSENRVFSYDRDSDGYVNAVSKVDTTTGQSETLFSVVYTDASAE